MATARAACLALLLVGGAAVVQAQSNKCLGVANGAKYRYQWMYQMSGPSEANKKALDEAVKQWMKEDCSHALAYGQGPAIPGQNAATFAITNPGPTQGLADYGAWSEFKSVDDIRKCYVNGIKSGNLAKVRKFSKAASRVILDLGNSGGSSKHSCSPNSLAPATIRYMYSYVLSNANADNCKKGVSAQRKLVAQDVVVRYGTSCDATAGDTSVYRPNVEKTGDFAGYIDFKNTGDLVNYFASQDANVKAARAELRSLAASAMRIAIAVPGGSSPAVAKESGAGRRLHI